MLALQTLAAVRRAFIKNRRLPQLDHPCLKGATRRVKRSRGRRGTKTIGESGPRGRFRGAPSTPGTGSHDLGSVPVENGGELKCQ